MKNAKGLGSIGVFLGIFLSRFLGEHFGFNSTIMVLSICILILLSIIIYFIAIRKLIGVIFFLSLSIPLVVGTVGIYLDMEILVDLAILSVFTILPASMILMKKFVERKRK